MITHLTALNAFIFSSVFWARKIFPTFCRTENETWRPSRRSWQNKGLDLLLPSPPCSIHKKPQTPIKPLTQGQWVLCIRYGQGEFFFSVALHFYPIYFFILQGQAVPWSRQQNWREYFSSTFIPCLPDGLHMELCEWARLQNVFCLGQWNSWGQPCHSVSLTLSLPSLCLGFSFSFSLCCLGYMGRFLICC